MSRPYSLHPGLNYNERIGCSSGEIINRSYKIFRLEPHPKKKIIVIRGELTIQITNAEANELLGEETRDFKKIIRLENLKEQTNVERVVEEIFERCPFIDKRYQDYLIAATEVLKNRSYDEYGLAVDDEEEADDGSEDFSDYFGGDGEADLEEDSQGPDMSSLEYYIELLYEELSDKVKGARCIARLAKMPENLVVIENHETALNALFRTLREDHKKSLDLTTSILLVCFYFSQFEDFHDMLDTNKICSITFDILEYEMTRNEKWKEEVYHRKELAESSDASAKVKHNFEKMMGRYSEVTRKQDDLLRVAFDVLFRMYEHPQIHDEILQRGIVGYLMEALERKNIDLLLLVVDFLKTLSIFAQCKTAMNQLQIIEKILLLVDSNFPNDLISLCLRLLYNLSFDTKMRHRMVKLGLLPKLGHFFGDPELEPVCLNIFYIMSMDRKIRPKIAPTNVIPILMRILSNAEDEPLNVEARSLAINLSHNKRCSSSMCANNGLASILSKAFEMEDPLMMKIVRNLSQHEGPTQELFIEYISDLASAITKVGARDFALECTGTLGNLAISDLDYTKLLKEFGLIPWIKSILQNPKNSSQSASKKEGKISLLDILCTVIFFLGTCAGDAECAEYLIQQNMVDLLLKVFNNRGDRPIDLDIKNHILYFFYKLSVHKKTRDYMVENTRIPQLLLDLLHDTSRTVRDICEGALELIGGYNEAWEARVKKERFLIYNEPWIEMIEKINKDPLLQADMELASSLGLPAHEMKKLESKLALEMSSSADTSDAIVSASDDSETEVDDASDKDEYAIKKGDKKKGKRGIPAAPPSREDGSDNSNEEEANNHKSIFDQFKHQFDYEMDRRERWEYGISDDDEEEDEDEDFQQHGGSSESLSYRVASAASKKFPGGVSETDIDLDGNTMDQDQQQQALRSIMRMAPITTPLAQPSLLVDRPRTSSASHSAGFLGSAAKPSKSERRLPSGARRPVTVRPAGAETHNMPNNGSGESQEVPSKFSICSATEDQTKVEGK